MNCLKEQMKGIPCAQVNQCKPNGMLNKARKKIVQTLFKFIPIRVICEFTVTILYSKYHFIMCRVVYLRCTCHKIDIEKHLEPNKDTKIPMTRRRKKYRKPRRIKNLIGKRCWDLIGWLEMQVKCENRKLKC